MKKYTPSLKLPEMIECSHGKYYLVEDVNRLIDDLTSQLSKKDNTPEAKVINSKSVIRQYIS